MTFYDLIRHGRSAILSDQLMRVMKLTTILILVFLVHASAAVLGQRITLHKDGKSLKQIFKSIKKQTGYNVVWPPDKINEEAVLNLSMNNIPLDEALRTILDLQNLGYAIRGKNIVVFMKDRPRLYNTADTTKLVTGKVTDTKGMAMPGITVKHKQGSAVVTTNQNGDYTIRIPEKGTLVFSYIGFTPQEIATSGKTQINLQLVEQEQGLSEIVVVGYGTQKKKDLLSAVSSIKGREIENLPVSTPQSLIQGRASGVQVVQNSGAPGSAVTLRIRGTTSINAGNDPLYIVDGVPVESGSLTGYNGRGGTPPSALSAINADDIESMEILKDAGALAIYGSRAANGVVLITTKRGSKGATTYNLSYYRGVQKDNENTRPKMLNSIQSLELIQEQRANAINDGITSLYSFILPDNSGNLANTDWQDAILRSAPISNYELAIRGGENKLRFALSGNYFDQEGIIINSGYQRGGGRLNLDYDATDKLKFGSNLSVTRYLNRRSSTDDGGLSLIQVALKKSPAMPLYNPNGTLYNDDVSGFINPVAYAERVKYENQVTSLLGNVYGEFEIIPGLRLRSTLGVNYASVLDTFFEPSNATRNGVSSGFGFSSNVTGWVNENTLSYAKTIGNHKVTGLLGYSQQKRRSFGLQASGSQYATDNIYTLNAASIATGVGSSVSANGLSSAFARVGYSFADKYLLEATARRDGSSRFGANKRYAMFPAVSAAWRISNESFWSGITAVNDFKLRASMGRTGNQSIDDYIAQGGYSTSSRYLGQSGVHMTTIPNPDLTWETTDQYNIGLDISMLNSRITLNADVYLKKTSNLLLNVPLPGTTGFSSVLQNVGATENKGLEFTLDTRNIEGKKFTWSSSFNISFNKNKVLSLNSGANEIILQKGAGLTGSLISYSVLRVGESIGSFYGWKSNGVYQYTTDNATGLTSTSIGANNYVFKGGDMMFSDVNGNKTIDDGDRMIIGSALPKFTGGFNNSFTYQNFDLNILTTFVYGNDVVNGSRFTVESDGRFSGSLDMLRRWRAEGDVTDIPRANHADPAGNKRFSNRWIEDGSYLRFKTVTLGYKLPTKLFNKTPIRNIRVYATAQNLFTITNYTGYDPEASSLGSGVTDIGIDQGTYPQYRTFIFGLSVGF
ncbi:TonB-dependent receptor [Pedobacter hiemivivus]|uniref:SusC/RagA family TonB-linked outer membrane protein n=1 Tax=Pedobacter hiemivivus TaxID=2530454 RepID=A0A4R0MYV4_9SPHI|nr:TonB-dependent receptor [Pedobacter hiemivivus]TCC92500.1 SusC/RagA family TonB-linked outer membrane protein [Pedobacter hiemivivus]